MPDDQRPRTPPTGPNEQPEASAQSRDEQATDDLESLAGALPSPSASEAPSEADEELDLGALAAVGGQRPSAHAFEADGRLSLGGISDAGTRPLDAAANTPGPGGPSPSPGPAPPSAPAVPEAPAMASPPVAPRARPAWLAPLLLGLGIGAGTAAAVFFATSSDSKPAGAAAGQAHPAVPGEPAAVPPLVVAASAAPATPPAPAQPAVAAAPAADAPASAPPTTAEPRPQRSAATETARRPVVAAPNAADPAPSSATTAPGPTADLLPGDPLADGEPQAADDKAAATPAADASAKTVSSVDALLDEALSPTARRDELARRQQLALAAEELPLTLGREDVTQAMTVLLPAIRGCAMGQSGLATAGIVVRGDGRVAGVEVTGAPFAGTASGRCMEGVIRRARFARFRQPILRIKFPLAIQ